MPAYSFQSRFAAPILAGTKRQTIRGPRKHHANTGDPLYLFTGMRTRQCRRLGSAVCWMQRPIAININAGSVVIPGFYDVGASQLDGFARQDGFTDWPDMQAFWREHHPGVIEFTGVILTWRDFVPAAPT